MKFMIKTFKFFIFIIIVALAALAFAIDLDIPRETLEAKYTNEASQFIGLSGGKIAHIRDEGKHNAPTLFLLHGSNASLQTWEGWVKTLKRDYRLISIDLPAHGLTGRMPGDKYETQAMADFVLETADHLKIDNFSIAGNSMGGEVALRVALKAPSRVAALVLISSSGMKQQDETKIPMAFRLSGNDIGRFVLRYITPAFLFERAIRDIVAAPDDFVNDEMVARYRDLTLMEGTRIATIKRSRLRRRDIEAQLAQITMPTLILWGKHDSLIAPNVGTRMNKAIQDSILIIYENAGHLAMEEIPEQSANDAHYFLLQATQ